MSVIFAFKDGHHCVSRNAMQPCECGHSQAGYWELFTPGADLFICEMCRWMVFAVFAGSARRGAATFSIGIQKIVRVASKPKMGGIDATWIISIWAIVANQHAVWNRAMMQFIGYARRFEVIGVASCIRLQCAIFMRISAASPEPTLIWSALLYFLPETFCQWAYRSQSDVMTGDKTNGLTFDMAQFGVALRGDGCRLTTAAFT